MSNKETKYQQQILFDDGLKVKDSDSDKKQLMASQVVVDNESWQEESDEFQIDEAIGGVEKKPNWLWRTIAVALPILVLVELVEFFIEGFENTPVLTSVYALVFACIAAIVGRTCIKEYKGLRQLRKNNQIRESFNHIIDKNNTEAAQKLCEKIHAKLPCDLTAEYENNWVNIAKSELSACELVQLYDQQVLSEVDKRALNIITKYSTESVVLVAVSPVALIDMALLMWRNLRMLDDLAQLYGIHLSYWSRIRLIKQVFVNMAFVGATELVTDVGLELVGADLVGKISARFAQGIGAGMLSARLGINAMNACRPIPYTGAKPKLSTLRKLIVSKLTKLNQKKSKLRFLRYI